MQLHKWSGSVIMIPFLKGIHGEKEKRASPHLAYIQEWQKQIRDYQNNSNRFRGGQELAGSCGRYISFPMFRVETK